MGLKFSQKLLRRKISVVFLFVFFGSGGGECPKPIEKSLIWYTNTSRQTLALQFDPWPYLSFNFQRKLTIFVQCMLILYHVYAGGSRGGNHVFFLGDWPLHHLCYNYMTLTFDLPAGLPSYTMCPHPLCHLCWHSYCWLYPENEEGQTH